MDTIATAGENLMLFTRGNRAEGAKILPFLGPKFRWILHVRESHLLSSLMRSMLYTARVCGRFGKVRDRRLF